MNTIIPFSTRWILLISIGCFLSAGIYAQSENNEIIPPDSLKNKQTGIIPEEAMEIPAKDESLFNKITPDTFMDTNSSYMLTPGFKAYLNKEFSIYRPAYLNTSQSPIDYGDYSTGGVIREFRRSAILGAGSQSTIIGVGKINTASISYLYLITPQLSVTVGANAIKYGFQNYMATEIGSSALISYQLHPQLSINVFGSYSRDLKLNLNNLNYGGYVDWAFSERFGADVGVNNYYDPYRRRWEMNPIVSPYIKVGEAKFGIDIGPAIKDAIINATQNNKHGNYAPAIPKEMGPINSFPVRINQR